MYAYTYDEYNRLTDANYYDYISGSWSSTGIYNTEYTYDKRGNFDLVTRDGKVVDGGCFSDEQIDDMEYNYYTNSNRLKEVVDAISGSNGFKENSSSTTTYTYDDNGNMVTDVEKGITLIEYNHLNLPTLIATSSDTIEFTYEADGNLLKKVSKSSSTTVETRDYVLGVEYVGGSSDAIYHSEGRLKKESGSWEWQYFIKDHIF